ncbi:hypothetical protein ASF60_13460 [Methylobacterium sp. Leaf113]|uniref:DUF2934 domain-containing protein n=1 Tax=Methylobacterium sp. Leaf113 TaxID=1736259 RepID=UPI0006FED645|nr:DUF2934 domain-containing protein [Methylobacterium sp. Leaf113]KQP94107.1 hypothetical protein ASF60_13460 [Methylobacterium sp. Leaf113]
MTTTNQVHFERIRERAYELWDRNHRPEGLDMQFWLLAERELRAAGMNTTEQAEDGDVPHEGCAA